MCRALILVSAFMVATFNVDTAGAPGSNASHPPALERFLARGEGGPSQYRALRHFEARNGHLDDAAWMDVWTEADDSGFRYEIVGQGGSSYVRSRLFMPALETERTMWGRGSRGAITPDNYLFEDRGAEPTGLAWIGVKPLRKDVMLVSGSIYLRPEDGDLVRIEGQLAKTPSFWTRRVDIVRHYRRIAGIRVPVRFESVASVRVAGRATFTMTYDYETLNGERVGRPAVVPTP
jgi:hypothetical protein